MSGLVLVADWPIQCCGEEFAVGDVVTWPIVPCDQDGGTWASVIGVQVDAGITGTYDSHGDEPPRGTTGVVRRVRTLSCRYGAVPPPADPRELQPVPGTGVLEDVMRIEKWYGTDFDPLVLRFCGWLVDLELNPSAHI